MISEQEKKIKIKKSSQVQNIIQIRVGCFLFEAGQAKLAYEKAQVA